MVFVDINLILSNDGNYEFYYVLICSNIILSLTVKMYFSENLINCMDPGY